MTLREIKSYAKLNLFLEIVSKRRDGYHNLESVFARISLFDVITVEKSKEKGIKLSLKDNANFGYLDEKKNLVYKAAENFCREFEIEPSLNINLVKNIPIGSGLGSGSSNAAATLRLLCDYYGIDIKENFNKLFKIAEKIGSDVPFFLYDYKFALCSGKGEIVKELLVKADLPNILVIWPDIFVSTKEVYSRLKLPSEAEIKLKLDIMKQLINNLAAKGKIEFGRYLFNRLEETAFDCDNRIFDIKKKLMENSDSVLMSGSGGSLFVLSYDDEALERLKSSFAPLHKFIFLAKFI
jgi:4-diphosphocytidyl-2-C-methyl-D-erythritol kinase